MKRIYGFIPIRICSSYEKEKIQKKFEEMETILQQNKKGEIYWANVYANQRYCFGGQGTQQQEFMSFSKKLVEQIEGSPQYISSIGFLNNPASNNSFHQPFHIDYNYEFKTLFIPMVELIYENSAQFFQHPLKSNPTMNYKGNYDKFGDNQKELLEQEGVDFLTISQVICKPFTILKIFPGTVHRGIRNYTNKDRLVFYIGYAQKKFILPSQEDIDS